MEYIPLLVDVQQQISSMPVNTTPFYLETTACFGCLQPSSGHQHNILK
jgi:hypothetical protein